MAEQFKYLLTPFKIRNVEVRNRVMITGHINNMARFGEPTEQEALYFAERSKGGVGLIVMGWPVVHPSGWIFPAAEKAYEDAIVPKFKMITDMVHQYGAKMFCQLGHPGRQGTSTFSKQPLLTATDIPCPTNLEMPKKAEPEDIEELIQGHADAAARARAGGFDGVEIHSGYGGYLVQQFLSPYSNHRTDEWGGSLENRMRLLKEIAKRVRKTVGDDFVVGLQLSGDEFTPGGLSLEDFKVIAREIDRAVGVDYITVKAGTYYCVNMIVPDMQHPLGLWIALAAGIREAVEKTPIFCVGRINDPLLAERVIAEGHADMVAMTRQHIADPETMNKTKEGRLDDIRECIGCNQGCIDTVYKLQHLTCIHNPAAGHEKELGIGTLKPAATRKKVVVIGGGPGGMKAAEVAARRGHQVVLFEKSDRLGGQILVAAKVPYRDEFRGIVRYLEHQLSKLPVEIRLNEAATADAVCALKPDAVVVATGSVPRTLGYENRRPDFTEHEGIHQPNVLTCPDALLHDDRVGQRVLVVEDGESNWKVLSTAIYFASQGKQVELITPLFYAGARVGLNSVGPLYAKLFELGIKMTPLTGFKGIRDKTATLFHAFTGAEWQAEYDTVVLCFYNRADDQLYFDLKGTVKDLHRVGDCLAPRGAQEAIHEAEHVARAL
jgi:mycofactocin system FadH/OYE family oxidoreductase 2